MYIVAGFCFTLALTAGTVYVCATAIDFSVTKAKNLIDKIK